MNQPRSRIDAAAASRSSPPGPQVPSRQNRPRLLVVDADRSVWKTVEAALDTASVRISTAGNSQSALRLMGQQHPNVVLLEAALPDGSGLDLCSRLHQIDSRLPVILMSDQRNSEFAIEATVMGAYDFLPKPFAPQTLREIIVQAISTQRQMSVPVGLAPAGGRLPENASRLVGHSPGMLDVYKAIGRVASEDVTVLIQGESGTGKELVARAIFEHSPRAEAIFMSVNCAAIPESLLESELFGHEQGAFTGADHQHIGKFEYCSGGTIFLDEIGDMSPLVQSKVLRLLQEQRFERVGGTQTIATDVRIIAATNRDLEDMVRDEVFRSDLYYRLHGFMIVLPPLRERGDDILRLLEHFLSVYSREMQSHNIEGISPDAVDLLLRYEWPGNVRELQSVVRQALLNANGPVIIPQFLPEEIRERQNRSWHCASSAKEDGARLWNLREFVDERLDASSRNLYAEALDWMESYVLKRVLRATQGNQTRAAEILGITRGKIRQRMNQFGISLDQVIHTRQSTPESG